MPVGYCDRPVRGILRLVTALRELERNMSEHGCERVRQGTRHDVWRSPSAQRPVTVSRHREIPFGTARPPKLDDSTRFQPPHLREAVEDVVGEMCPHPAPAMKDFPDRLLGRSRSFGGRASSFGVPPRNAIPATIVPPAEMYEPEAEAEYEQRSEC
jgi:hypothetical protein